LCLCRREILVDAHQLVRSHDAHALSASNDDALLVPCAQCSARSAERRARQLCQIALQENEATARHPLHPEVGGDLPQDRVGKLPKKRGIAQEGDPTRSARSQPWEEVARAFIVLEEHSSRYFAQAQRQHREDRAITQQMNTNVSEFQAEQPGEASWDYLEQGPEVWRVRIGRTRSS
jgi:hypothetical protein